MTVLTTQTRSRFGAVRFDVVRSGRPWWQARYIDGREIAEWETPPDVVTKHARPLARLWRSSRWEEVSKRGLVGMRLLCPNGTAGEIETNNPEGRFIELKVGGRDIALLGGVSRPFTIAHLIGGVADDGTCEVYAYERYPHPLALDLATQRCVTCNLDPQTCSGRDVTVTRTDRIIEHVPDPAWPERVTRERVYDDELHFASTWVPLVHFTDNVYDMRYHRVGRLDLDVQGLHL